MLRRILVPLDGTPFAERALPTAVMLARAAEGTLYLVHVHEPLVPVTEVDAMAVVSPELDRELLAVERDQLEEVAERLRERTGIPVQRAVRRGEVVRTLHDVSAAADIDLVVMASHERGALGRLFVGSVAERAAREPGPPVLVLRHAEARGPDDASGMASLPLEAQPFRHVLVPLDGSPHAESALDPALDLARLCGARVTVLGVREPLLAAAALAAPESTESPYLTVTARRLEGQGVRAAAHVVDDRNAAHAIVRAGEELGADVIALATHGRGGLARIAMGGVATGVLHRAKVAVLVLNPGRGPDRPSDEGRGTGLL